jgi:hypothetical protein
MRITAGRLFLGLLFAASALALAPQAVTAEYYFSERGAQRVTKDAARKLYGYNRYTMGVYCRPQGQRRTDPRFKYHRWVCTWAADDEGCEPEPAFGEMLIVGRSGRGSYGYKVLRGAHCR